MVFVLVLTSYVTVKNPVESESVMCSLHMIIKSACYMYMLVWGRRIVRLY